MRNEKYKLHIESLLNVKKTMRNKETGETALTASHTLTLRQLADNWQMSGEVGNIFSLHTLYLPTYLFFRRIFIHLYAQI